MGMLSWDRAARGGTAVLLLLARNFSRDWRRSPTARIGTLLTVAALCYLFLPALPASDDGAWWRPQLFGKNSPALL